MTTPTDPARRARSEGVNAKLTDLWGDLVTVQRNFGPDQVWVTIRMRESGEEMAMVFDLELLDEFITALTEAKGAQP